VKGAALAARDDMAELAKLLARVVGVKEGESTLSVFLGLRKRIELALLLLVVTERLSTTEPY
jgi:hypothetical protein